MWILSSTISSHVLLYGRESSKKDEYSCSVKGQKSPNEWDLFCNINAPKPISIDSLFLLCEKYASCSLQDRRRQALGFAGG